MDLQWGINRVLKGDRLIPTLFQHGRAYFHAQTLKLFGQTRSNVHIVGSWEWLGAARARVPRISRATPWGGQSQSEYHAECHSLRFLLFSCFLQTHIILSKFVHMILYLLRGFVPRGIGCILNQMMTIKYLGMVWRTLQKTSERENFYSLQLFLDLPPHPCAPTTPPSLNHSDKYCWFVWHLWVVKHFSISSFHMSQKTWIYWLG